MIGRQISAQIMSKLYENDDNKDSIMLSLIQLVRRQRDSLKFLSGKLDEYKFQISRRELYGIMELLEGLL